MPRLRPSPKWAVVPALLPLAACDALEWAVLRETSRIEARFIPAEIGAGVGMALVNLMDYRQRAEQLAAAGPAAASGGCVIAEVEDLGDGEQLFTFNHYGCPEQTGYVYATLAATPDSTSVTLDYVDYSDGSLSVWGTMSLEDQGDGGRLELDYSTHYDGLSADLAAVGRFAPVGDTGYTATVAGDLGSAAGLDWKFDASGLEFADGCEGLVGGSVAAGWEGTTTVETVFPEGSCTDCYNVSVDGGDVEEYCPGDWLE